MTTTADKKMPLRGRAAWRTLSKDLIVEKALELVEATSVEALSMRKLGEAIGVDASALYYYFPNKSALIQDMAQSLLREIALPDPAAADWRGQIEGYLRSVRRMALRHPQSYALAWRDGDQSVVRDTMVALVATWQNAGIAREPAIGATLAVFHYITGATVFGRFVTLPRFPRKTGTASDAGKSSERKRMSPEAREKVFNFAVESLLTGIEIVAKSRRPVATGNNANPTAAG